jgi:hypothetical protein
VSYVCVCVFGNHTVFKNGWIESVLLRCFTRTNLNFHKFFISVVSFEFRVKNVLQSKEDQCVDASKC